MKCYVSDTKNNNLIVDALTKKDAVKKFIVYFQGKNQKIARYISVSETGFSSTLDTESVFDAGEIEHELD